MKVKKTINIVGYMVRGSPMCATDFNNGKVCQFYRTQRFGTIETCLFAPPGYRGMSESLPRSKNGQGVLIPGGWCPIWKVSDKEGA